MRDTVLSVSVKVFNTSDSFGWVDMAALSKDALLTSSKITDTLSTHDVKLQSHAWTLLICKLRTGPTLRGKSLKKEKPESNHVWHFHSSTCWFCMEKASLSTVASPSAFLPLSQVTMADRSAADRACKDPNPIIDGRKANVNLAYLGAKPRVMQPGKDEGKVIRPFMEPQNPVLMVCNPVRFSLLPVKKHFHTGISGESVVYLVGRKTLGHWIVALEGHRSMSLFH